MKTLDDYQPDAKEPRFTCRLCRKRTPASKGCDDMFPHLCDDCWAQVSMAPEAVEMRSRVAALDDKRKDDKP